MSYRLPTICVKLVKQKQHRLGVLRKIYSDLLSLKTFEETLFLQIAISTYFLHRFLLPSSKVFTRASSLIQFLRDCSLKISLQIPLLRSSINKKNNFFWKKAVDSCIEYCCNQWRRQKGGLMGLNLSWKGALSFVYAVLCLGDWYSYSHNGFSVSGDWKSGLW